MPSLDRDGVAIHYEIHGADTGRAPVVLSHGYAASAAMWSPNVGAISAERQVIMWDLRGHGDSDSPRDPDRYSVDASVGDLRAVLDACGVERALLGGHSLGGYLSLAFRIDHPDRVAALLLFNTGPGFWNDAGRDGWNAMAEQLAVRFERRGVEALSESPEVVGGRHDPLGLSLAARGILPQRDSRVIASLPEIDVPALVLVGEHDKPFLAAADYMATKIPGATKVVIPDAGHAANLDQPDAFNAAVARFLGDRTW